MDFKEITKQAIDAQTPPTGYKLAKTLGVKPDTVYGWRDGKTEPRARYAFQMLEMAKKVTATAALAIFGTLLLPIDDASAAHVKGEGAIYHCILC